jgi:hypothetical protein
MSIMTPQGQDRASSLPPSEVLRCTAEGCGGIVMRHSIGCGMAVRRCERCFARYEYASPAGEQRRPALRRLLHELASWRDDD